MARMTSSMEVAVATRIMALISSGSLLEGVLWHDIRRTCLFTIGNLEGTCACKVRLASSVGPEVVQQITARQLSNLQTKSSKKGLLDKSSSCTNLTRRTLAFAVTARTSQSGHFGQETDMKHNQSM